MHRSLSGNRVQRQDLLLFAGGGDIDGFEANWWHVNGSRHGIPRTLHRLSGISGRQGELIGVVIRVGRSITGVVEKMLPTDLRCSRESVLLVGPPNSGKTTVLREFARLLSDQEIRGNHSSNTTCLTTCLTHAFFKSCEYCETFNYPY